MSELADKPGLSSSEASVESVNSVRLVKSRSWDSLLVAVLRKSPGAGHA